VTAKARGGVATGLQVVGPTVYATLADARASVSVG
jgi:hypothetical protein